MTQYNGLLQLLLLLFWGQWQSKAYHGAVSTTYARIWDWERLRANNITRLVYHKLCFSNLFPNLLHAMEVLYQDRHVFAAREDH